MQPGSQPRLRLGSFYAIVMPDTRRPHCERTAWVHLSVGPKESNKGCKGAPSHARSGVFKRHSARLHACSPYHNCSLAVKHLRVWESL